MRVVGASTMRVIVPSRMRSATMLVLSRFPRRPQIL
jgi:hypothetical protein